MKTLFFTILPLFAMSQPVDKMLHFGAGYIIGSATSALTYDFKINKHIEIGIGAATLAGLGKELRDQYVYQGFDIMDAVTTVAGGVCGSLTIKIALNRHSNDTRK
jgi:VanZ family protein